MRASNLFESIKSSFFRKPLAKARNKFFSEIQLYTPNSANDANYLNNNRPGKDIIREGNLRIRRRGFRKTNPRTWQEMHAILEDARLFLYKDGDENPRNIITLDEEVGIYPEDVHDKIAFYCIRLTSKDLSYSICAQNENDRDIWLTVLLTAISEKLLKSSASRQNPRYSMY